MSLTEHQPYPGFYVYRVGPADYGFILQIDGQWKAFLEPSRRGICAMPSLDEARAYLEARHEKQKTFNRIHFEVSLILTRTANDKAPGHLALREEPEQHALPFEERVEKVRAWILDHLGPGVAGIQIRSVWGSWTAEDTLASRTVDGAGRTFCVRFASPGNDVFEFLDHEGHLGSLARYTTLEEAVRRAFSFLLTAHNQNPDALYFEK